MGYLVQYLYDKIPNNFEYFNMIIIINLLAFTCLREVFNSQME